MNEVTRYRPFLPMRNLRREIDRLFGDFLPGMGEEEGPEHFSTVWRPRMDLAETDGEFLLTMELPGIDKDEVTVNVDDGQLTVSGERSDEQKEEKKNYLRMERIYGSFYRSIPLPATANVDAVKAEFKNGVLTVHIPKTEEKQPRKVQIA